jgi:superfamily II DNA helicase RecQ
MAYRVFVIPNRGDEAAEAELNAFLRSHRVMTVDRRWVDQGGDSFWSVCVDYVERAPAGASSAPLGKDRVRVDYRALLGEAGYAVYERLRGLRTELSAQEHVPPYLIFNNDQLAQMIQKQARTKSDLAALAGVGDARVEKYGPRFLELLAATAGPAEAQAAAPAPAAATGAGPDGRPA